jgi:predicted dehydrogenase
MSETPVNPLLTHPALAPVAGEIARGTLGQRLAAYASARSKRRDGDPLRDLGTPLLDYLLTILGGTVESVLATNERLTGKTADAWFLTIRYADGLVATVDLGTFLPDSYPLDFELRFEICGTDRVIVADPANVAVTVIGPAGLTRDDAYPESYQERLMRFANAVQAGDVASAASSVINAAQRSAQTGEVVIVT